MSKYWSEFVGRLDPYVPGAQGGGADIVKLNTNENPYPPSPAVQKALQQFGIDQLRRYPQPESDALVEVIARYHGVDPAQVFVGNGSDEVLAHAFNALFRRGAPLLMPGHSYSFYPVYCKLYDIEYTRIPLQQDFSIDLQQYGEKAGGVVFANPNAPTGLFIGQQALRDCLGRLRDTVMLVDEAYVDFASAGTEDVSAVPLLAEFDNLLVTRTLSKSRSLAGLRLGYALGSPGLIEGIRRVKNSFNSYPVDALASALAIASFQDDDYFRATCRRVIAERERLQENLQQRGFKTLDSSANFLMAAHPARDARTLYEGLLERKVWVRYFDQPRISDYLRISIGSGQENDALLLALDDML